MTIADLERELIVGRQLGHWLAKVGIDGTTIDGTNAALNGAIRQGLGRAGYATLDPLVAADDDLAPVLGADVDHVLDVAELVTLKLIRSAFGRWVEQHPPKNAIDAEMIAAEGRRIERAIDQLQARNNDAYGDSLGTATGGTVDLGFAQGEEATF